MGIQCSLNFGDICHVYFRDMGIFKIIKGIWDTGTPLSGPQRQIQHQIVLKPEILFFTIVAAMSS